MKALVTGGTGFVGSHVARALIDRGYEVRVLHRATSRLVALAGLDYESVIGDILDSDALRAACKDCEWVFHVAAVADYWRSDHERMFAANVEGTRRVLDAAHECGVKRVVFTSSAAAVGLRDDGLPSDESIAFNLAPQQFPYGYSKVRAEAVVLDAVQRGQDVVIVNPVVVMGPGDLNLISGGFVTHIKRLQWTIPVTSGGVSVTDVRDVARWHLAAAEKGRRGERYLLSTANYSFRDWYGMVADEVGVARPLIPAPDLTLPPLVKVIEVARRLHIPLPVDGDQARLGSRNVYFDARKAWDELGPPAIEMQQSLRDTYAWYLEHGYIKEDALSRLLSGLGRLIGRKTG